MNFAHIYFTKDQCQSKIEKSQFSEFFSFFLLCMHALHTYHYHHKKTLQQTLPLLIIVPIPSPLNDFIDNKGYFCASGWFAVVQAKFAELSQGCWFWCFHCSFQVKCEGCLSPLFFGKGMAVEASGENQWVLQHWPLVATLAVRHRGVFWGASSFWSSGSLSLYTRSLISLSGYTWGKQKLVQQQLLL